MEPPAAAPPAVIVHGPADLRIALAPGRPVTLLSAPGAALYAGCAWWRALVAEAVATHPGLVARDLLDCGDAPGRALEALRIGQKALILAAEAPGFAEVAATAMGCGAVLQTGRPPALDLAAPGAARRLQAWLEHG